MHGELLVFTIAIGFPDFPRSCSTGAKTLEFLFVLEGVHARPEPVIGIADQLFLFQQSLKRFPNKFLFLFYVIENLFLENEESAVDANRAVVDGVNSRNQISLVLLQRN